MPVRVSSKRPGCESGRALSRTRCGTPSRRAIGPARTPTRASPTNLPYRLCPDLCLPLFQSAAEKCVCWVGGRRCRRRRSKYSSSLCGSSLAMRMRMPSRLCGFQANGQMSPLVHVLECITYMYILHGHSYKMLRSRRRSGCGARPFRRKRLATGRHFRGSVRACAAAAAATAWRRGSGPGANSGQAGLRCGGWSSGCGNVLDNS